MTEDNERFSFKCEANCSHTQARAGVFATPHGVVETPKFMPVGTLANVKTLTPAHLEAAGSQMVLANTYHLHLQPGEAIVAGAGAVIWAEAADASETVAQMTAAYRIMDIGAPRVLSKVDSGNLTRARAAILAIDVRGDRRGPLVQPPAGGAAEEQHARRHEQHP